MRRVESPSGVVERGERVFRALASHAPVGIFVSSAAGECEYVNERWCELTGLSPEQALGEGWKAALHPADAPRVMLEWKEAAREARDSVAEYRFVRPDGGLSWVEGFASAVRDERGRVTGWVGTCVDVTARKLAEAALRSESERFRIAFDGAPIGMALLTPEGRWSRVNKALCELLGYDEAQLLELSFADVTHPDDLPSSMERWRRHMAGEQVRSIQKRYIRADGEVIWAAVTSTVVRDARGEPLYDVAQIEDVTDRARAQTALEEAEERFRRAFDDAPIGMALVAPDGRWLRVNRRVCEITGFSEEELLRRTVHDVTHPDDRDAGLEQGARLVAGEIGRVALEKRYIRADGETVWIALSASLVRDRDGRPLYVVSQLEDIGERKHAEEELRRLAERDPLTGVLNRRAFEQAFEQAAARYTASRPGALLLVDIDDFKLINDTVGHAAGDEVLSRLAQLLLEWTRPGDVVGRLGGDEFVVLASDVGEKGALEIAQRLIAEADGLRFGDPEHSFDVRLSVGLCFLDGSAPPRDGLARADVALYQAKARGKHRAVAWQPGTRERQLFALGSVWAVRIKDALRDGRLAYELQPIFDLASREIASFEALVRMRDDDGRLISAGEFLPAAERFGLTPQVDRWMVEQALELLGSESREPGTIFLNLAAASLADDTLIAFVKEQLAALPPGLLGFEITERAAVADVSVARDGLSDLHALGCPLAVDDFGVDFASFERLRELPVDFVKVGKPFVPRLHADPADRAIVRSIVEVAHALGRRVIVSGIEDAATARIIRELGAEFGQGFWWAAPVVAPQALPALSAR